MKTSRCLLAALLLFGTLGCYKATFVRNVPQQGGEKSTVVLFFLFGLIGNKTISVQEFCPDGNVRMVRTGGNVGTDIVFFLTAGIVAPRKIWVQCGSGGVAENNISNTNQSYEVLLDQNDQPKALLSHNPDGTIEVGTVERGTSEGEWVATFARE